MPEPTLSELIASYRRKAKEFNDVADRLESDFQQAKTHGVINDPSPSHATSAPIPTASDGWNVTAEEVKKALHGRAMRPRSVAAALEAREPQVRSILEKLIDAGEVVRLKRGWVKLS